MWTGILTESERDELLEGLGGILEDLESGVLAIDPGCEDIHMFIEQVLTQRIGETGKKLHTARSRNDQVALDLRLYLRGECEEIGNLIKALIETLTDLLQKPPSITISFPPPLTGLSPFFAFTGTCPLMIWQCGPSRPNSFRIMSQIAGSW